MKIPSYWRFPFKTLKPKHRAPWLSVLDFSFLDCQSRVRFPHLKVNTCVAKYLRCNFTTYRWQHAVLSLVNRLRRTHEILCPNMRVSLHVWPLVSIIIPKQSIINEPWDAYLSEPRQIPPPLLLGWGCHGDRSIDRERVGGGGGAAGVRWRREGTSLRTLALCLSDVSLCFACQSSISVSARSVKEQFMNFSQSSFCQAASWL